MAMIVSSRRNALPVLLGAAISACSSLRAQPDHGRQRATTDDLTPELAGLHLVDVSQPSVGSAVALESWTKPALRTRWSLVDHAGWIGDVTIISVDSDRPCDHCPRYLAIAKPFDRLRGPFDAPVFAIGPVVESLHRARVLMHESRWWETWERSQKVGDWVLETAVDIDGDGMADLARFATGAFATFEVRVRVGTSWRVTQRWFEPLVLDVDDEGPRRD